ncbi:MAG TPA: hypothetical protein QGF58_21600 [Myxococcota bacterium]|nr:hypothetical protein [Myxococcota bacterium]
MSWRLGVFISAAVAVGLALSYGACTQDDAFISFRYAENLVNGHGLVYNPGDYVEGYTNLSWTLLMAAGLGLDADPVVFSTACGLLSLALAIVATAWLSREPRMLAALVAPLLVALDPQVAAESVEGLETALYMALLTLAVFCALRERDADRPHLASTALFALACLTRPEAPLVMLLLHVGLLLDCRRAGGSWVRRVLSSSKAGLALALVLAGLTAWRLAYYGDPFPNTFYAKTGGFALPRGLQYLAAHALSHPVLWLLVAGRALVARSDKTVPLAVTALGFLAYVAWIGGDFKPTGRFVMPVLPLLAVLAGETISRWARSKVLLVLAGLALAGQTFFLDSEARAWAGIRHANLEARRDLGDFLAETVPADKLLAIHSAGAVPYYAGHRTIDMWGLTDRHIARTDNLTQGSGMAGHEKGDPDYVFSLGPDIYLPEDKVFALKAWALEPEANFPADFEDRYLAVSVPVDGRWLNCWVRRDATGIDWM